MDVRARPVGISHIADMRERYRAQARCQIVRDSILPRGLADAYVLEVAGEATGYAAVWNRHFPGRIMEFCANPESRGQEGLLIRALIEASGANALEVQTNLAPGRRLVEQWCSHVEVENLLFGEGRATEIFREDARFRRRREGDVGPEGAWVLEMEGEVVGAGGWLSHYNPPHVDLFMEVVKGARRSGLGSYLVQELRRACTAEGLRAAARCDPTNVGSRRALEAGGLVLCGEIVAGPLGLERLRAARPLGVADS